MKFQDSSFNSLNVTAGIKRVEHARTHAQTAICPIYFFKVGGIKTSYAKILDKRHSFI